MVPPGVLDLISAECADHVPDISPMSASVLRVLLPLQMSGFVGALIYFDPAVGQIL
jgi:hypothetical protein